MPFSLTSCPPVYAVPEFHAAAQLPPEVPELDEDDEDDDDDDEEDEDEDEDEDELEELLSAPMYCQRVVVVGFQPVEE
jgi:hypothetical protein